MHTESLAVIQKQWREKNSELEFVIDPSLENTLPTACHSAQEYGTCL